MMQRGYVLLLTSFFAVTQLCGASTYYINVGKNPDYYDQMVDEMEKHFFIGIFGYPNSGNDWMYEMLRYTPDTSTMIEACYNHTLKRVCRGKNFNGQSLERGRPITDKLLRTLHPRKFCTIPETNTEFEAMEKLMMMWMKYYWDHDKTYFMDNSDHFMLRLPQLKEGAKRLSGAKYLITVRHPLCTGGHHRQPWSRLPKEKLEDRLEEFEIWLTMDGAKISSSASPMNTSCSSFDPLGSSSLSWLSSMNALHTILEKDKEWSQKQVRIVRHEDFVDRPLSVCEEVHKFLFLDDKPSALESVIKQKQQQQQQPEGSPYFWTERDIQNHCKKLFPKEPSPSATTGRGPTGYLFGWTSNVPEDGSIPPTFPYDKGRINATCSSVLNSYSLMHARLDPEAKGSLAHLDKKTSAFGYSMTPRHFYDASKSQNKFTKWEIFSNSKV